MTQRCTRSGTWPGGPACRYARSGATPTPACASRPPWCIRTLREFGVDLASVNRVLAEEITVSQAAADVASFVFA